MFYERSRNTVPEIKLIDFSSPSQNLYEEEAYIVQLLSSRKLDTQLFRICQDLR